MRVKDLDRTPLCECGCGSATKTGPRVRGHNRRLTTEEYIAKNTVQGEGGCLLWTTNLDKNGYGWTERGGEKQTAHRFLWETEIGPIPDGLEIDHLCRVRACVNAAHLEPVTRAENNRRKAAAITRCPQGHEYTPENSYRPPGTPNRRFCAACRHAARIRRAVKHLSPEMLNMLWTAAQMKYGWAWVPRRHGQHQVAEALVRRGMVVYERDYRRSRIWITEAGRAECERRWPVSPFVLGTYEHQPGGWTPREGVAA